MQQREFGWALRWPWQTCIEIPRLLRSDRVLLSGWLNLMGIVPALPCAYWAFSHIDPGLAIYYSGLLSIFLITSRQGESLASWGRHTLFLFPLSVCLGA